jgi:hypothetical protein
VIALNREENVRKGKKHKIAFAEIRPMDLGDTIGAYAAYLKAVPSLRQTRNPIPQKTKQFFSTLKSSFYKPSLKGSTIS